MELWSGKPEEQAELPVVALIESYLNDSCGRQLWRGLIDYQHQDSTAFGINTYKQVERVGGVIQPKCASGRIFVCYLRPELFN
jgi:hypothetical protein